MSEDFSVEKIEEAAPLYDQVRWEYFNTCIKASNLYSVLIASYPKKRNKLRGEPVYDDVGTISPREQEFRVLVHKLYVLTRPDVITKSMAIPEYKVLEELTDENRQHSLSDFFRYYELLRDFLGRMGIFKIGNISYKHKPGAMALKGFAESGRRKY